MPNQIPIDPALPEDFDDLRNEDRSAEELDQWWDHPYCVRREGGGFEVRCLNGGAWDRSSWLGDADDYPAACRLAETRQAAWVALREKPLIAMMEVLPMLVRMPQRPDRDIEVLRRFASQEEYEAWRKEQSR